MTPCIDMDIKDKELWDEGRTARPPVTGDRFVKGPGSAPPFLSPPCSLSNKISLSFPSRSRMGNEGFPFFLCECSAFNEISRRFPFKLLPVKASFLHRRCHLDEQN